MGDNRSEVELRNAMQQVDDVLIVNWIAVEDGDYRKALAELVQNAIKQHDDPSVSQAAEERERLVKEQQAMIAGLAQFTTKQALEIDRLKAQLAAVQIRVV